MVPMLHTDVVCFESAPQDEHGRHSAVLLRGTDHGAFPPNTSFALREVLAPGTWEAPGGCFPQQFLYVVLPTYGAPRTGRKMRSL